MGRGITVKHIYGDQLKHLTLALPPLSEQAAIASFLDQATTDLDAATTSAQRETSLLREYRTRLIADVVTGKLDVREASAALPEVDSLESEEDPDDTLDADTQLDLNEVGVVAEEVEA